MKTYAERLNDCVNRLMAIGMELEKKAAGDKTKLDKVRELNKQTGELK